MSTWASLNELISIAIPSKLHRRKESREVKGGLQNTCGGYTLDLMALVITGITSGQVKES